MRYVVALFFLSSLILIGCARSPLDDPKNYQTTPPLKVPPGVSLKKSTEYYAVPNGPAARNNISPSLVPPGSHLERFNKKETPTLLKTPETRKPVDDLSLQEVDGQPTLYIPKPPAVVWEQLEKALKKTQYRILDQDETLHSYYVLDMQNTDNKLTQTTPVYRIYLKPNTDPTAVVLCKDSACQNDLGTVLVAKRILIAIKNHWAG